MNPLDRDDHISTKEVKDILKISDCSVMHLRTEGKIRFHKKGNAFLYLRDDVEKLVNIDLQKDK